MDSRLSKLYNWLEKKEIELCFIQTKENIFYLTNYYTDPHERLMGLFLSPGKEPFFVCPEMEVQQLKHSGWKHEVIGYLDHENPWELVKTKLKKNNISEIESLALEKDSVSYSRVQYLQNIVQATNILAVEEIINEHRVIKDHSEVEILRQAADLADFGVQAGINALKEGVTEMEVLAEIELQLKKRGIRQMAFSTMVLFGPNSGNPHGHPGQNTLKAGDIVLFDLGVVLNGYCSDITRTVVYKEYNETQKKIYDVVLDSQLSALKECKPGKRIGDLDIAARTIIENAGYGKDFPHRLGHGLGINVHEYPSMDHLNNEVLKEGMVFTIEPGVYIPAIGGVRIEDDVLITINGYETLTKFPKEFMVIK